MKCSFCDRPGVARLNNKWLLCTDHAYGVSLTSLSSGKPVLFKNNGEPEALLLTQDFIDKHKNKNTGGT